MRYQSVSLILAILLLCLCPSAPGQRRPKDWYNYLYPVVNFQASQPLLNDGRDDFYFEQTNFLDPVSRDLLSFTLTYDHLGMFRDGNARWARGWQTGYIGWSDPVLPIATYPRSAVWNLDRSVMGVPYADENSKSPLGSLQEFWGQEKFVGNLSRVMDTTSRELPYEAWLRLYFGTDSNGNLLYIQDDPNTKAPELVLFEAKASGAVYARAILMDGSRTDPIGISFETDLEGIRYDGPNGENLGNVPNRGGEAFVKYERYIDSPAYLSGVGIDLKAWGLTSERVIGFEIYFLANDFCSAPDILGFVLQPKPVPEASTLTALAMMLAGGVGAVLRARSGRRWSS